MIRNFNYTDRKRIPRAQTDFSVSESSQGPLEFKAKLRLDNLGLPEDAAVYVEAYYSAYVMRFPFGRVGKLAPPKNRLLDELPTREIVHFRVKIVDEASNFGLIVADADRITATKSGRLSLLHVDPKPLGNQVWRLNLDDAWPKLEVNNDIRDLNMFDIIKSSAAFRSLVLPSLLRSILTHLVIMDAEVDADTQDHWGSSWHKFGTALAGGATCPPCGESGEQDNRLAWVESVVTAFCHRHRISDMFRSSVRQGDA